MNPLSLITGVAGPLLKVAGKALGISSVTDSIADAISGASPEKKAEMAQALAALNLEEMKVEASMIHDDDDVEKAEVQSTDKFVARARPSLLYLAGAITALVALTDIVLAIFAAIHNTPPVVVPAGVTAELLIPLWGHAGFYAYQRTKEKIAKAA